MDSHSTSGTPLRGPLTTGNCSVWIIDADISDITGILCYIATALGPNRSALLILILSGLLGICLLLVLVLLFMLLRLRSKQSKAVEGMPTLKQLISTNVFKDKQPCEKDAPNHSTVQYSLAQSVEIEERNDETDKVSEVSEHDYEDPPGDEYMNADEINTVTIGHQIYHLG